MKQNIPKNLKWHTDPADGVYRKTKTRLPIWQLLLKVPNAWWPFLPILFYLYTSYNHNSKMRESCWARALAGGLDPVRKVLSVGRSKGRHRREVVGNCRFYCLLSSETSCTAERWEVLTSAQDIHTNCWTLGLSSGHPLRNLIGILT